MNIKNWNAVELFSKQNVAQEQKRNIKQWKHFVYLENFNPLCFGSDSMKYIRYKSIKSKSNG